MTKTLFPSGALRRAKKNTFPLGFMWFGRSPIIILNKNGNTVSDIVWCRIHSFLFLSVIRRNSCVSREVHSHSWVSPACPAPPPPHGFWASIHFHLGYRSPRNSKKIESVLRSLRNTLWPKFFKCASQISRSRILGFASTGKCWIQTVVARRWVRTRSYETSGGFYKFKMLF